MATCYRPPTTGSGTNLSICGADSVPCSPTQAGTYNSTSAISLCCAEGDTCGAKSICKMQTLRQPLGTGYYLGGCTDPTFVDPLCRSDCAGSATEIIIYKPALNVWSCCGVNSSGAVDCSVVYPQLSFQALYPQDDFPGPLQETLTPAPQGTSFAASIIATSTASAGTIPTSQPAFVAPTEASTSSPSTDKGLSTGAKAGIGTGAAVAGLVLVALCLAVHVYRKRQASHGNGQRVHEMQGNGLASRRGVYSAASTTYEADEAHAIHEADPAAWAVGSHERRAELGETRIHYEMPATSVPRL